MYYLNFLNKEIISIFDGKICGNIKQGIVNEKGKLTSFLVEQNNNIFALSVKDIFAYTFDKVMIKNSTKLIISQATEEQKFLNKPVFTIYGKNLGIIKDIVFSKNYIIEKIITNKSEFLFKDIVINENIVIINENSKYKKHHFGPQILITPKSTNQKVMVATTKIPIKVMSHGFLIGKKLFKDFVSKDGIIFARKNSIITFNILNIAKNHGLLDELNKCAL